MDDHKKLLRKVSIFSQLKDNELSVVAGHSSFRHYAAGETVFQAGEASLALYVVKEGEVRITGSDGGGARDIARFIPGESFGELDLFEDAPHDVNAIAERDSVLLLFPSEGIDFAGVLQRHPDISARILYKLLAVVSGRIRGTNRLISEKTQWVEELRGQVLVDKLTGLYNRSYLEEELIPNLSEKKGIAGVLMVKPDNFKRINDSFGHEAGDRALTLLASVVSGQLDSSAVAVRYRGDEFAVVCPGSDEDASTAVAKRICEAVGETSFDDITGVPGTRITASVGVAVYPLEADSRSVVRTAYERMWTARTSGGGKVICG